MDKTEIVEIIQADKLVTMIEKTFLSEFDDREIENIELYNLKQPRTKQTMVEGSFTIYTRIMDNEGVIGQSFSVNRDYWGDFEVNCQHVSGENKPEVDLSELEVIMSVSWD